MKANRQHGPAYFAHHREIEDVGQMNKCPIRPVWVTEEPEAQLTNTVTWLRLQAHRLQYRVLYADVVVCCTYILFIFTTLRFHTMVASDRWLYAFTLMVLFGSCVAFIGVHLAPHRRDRSRTEQLGNDWAVYRTYLQRWPLFFKAYSAFLLIAVLLFVYNERSPSTGMITGLLMVTGLLFAFGVNMIFKTLQAKQHTQSYMSQATRHLK